MLQVKGHTEHETDDTQISASYLLFADFLIASIFVPE
jgi:hypothetical protein